MNIKEYLITENVEKTLYQRYLKALDKGQKIQNTIGNLGTELNRIQKQMKKNNIPGLLNPAGLAVFTDDEDTADRAWSMVAGS